MKKNSGFELKKILMIVEDFDFIRNLVGKYFLRDGYEIISAGNMQEAMVIGQWEQPKMVIVDFDMSNDTYLIVSILHSILPASQIIMVNGRSRHCNSEEAKTAGVNRILERLFNPEVLEEIIQSLAVDAVLF
jgi:DNA-binding NtrC family response regulator